MKGLTGGCCREEGSILLPNDTAGRKGDDNRLVGNWDCGLNSVPVGSNPIRGLDCINEGYIGGLMVLVGFNLCCISSQVGITGRPNMYGRKLGW